MQYFHETSININLYGFKIINWTMNGSVFKPTAPVSFYVDKARSGGEWTNVAGPIVDDCHYTDATLYDFNKELNTYYRIRYLLGSEWIYSTPVQAGNSWTWDDWKLAREMIRKEYLVMRRVGQQGILLKRKQWGTPCPTCRDYDTREVIDRNCQVCFGVGIVGGYYSPIDMPIWSVTPMVSKTKAVTVAGTLQPAVNNARVVAYPLLETFDVWIDSNSNERWYIDAIKPVAEVKGIPIIEMVTFNLKPYTDVIYTLEVNNLASSVPAEQPTGTEHTWSRKLDCIGA